jgi:hypothetical protein
MPRKRIDPKRQALEDRVAKLQAECERHYRRMRLAFNRLEKARRALARVSKRLEALDSAPMPAETH